MNGYDLIVAKAEELKPAGFLEQFESDLTTHDRKLLEVDAGQFVWAIGKVGTYLLTKSRFAKSQLNATLYLARGEDLISDGYRVFHFDGRLLNELVRSEDVTRVMDAWTKATSA